MPPLPAHSFPHALGRLMPALGPGVSLIAGGLGALAAGLPPVIAWVALGGGAAVLVAFVLPLLLRVPMIAFDEHGLRARLPGFGAVAWRDIERVRLVRLHGRGRAFLVVERTAEAQRRRRGGRWPRMLARAAGGKDLAAPLDGLTATPDQIAAVVQLAHAHGTGAVGVDSGPAPRRIR